MQSCKLQRSFLPLRRSCVAHPRLRQRRQKILQCRRWLGRILTAGKSNHARFTAVLGLKGLKVLNVELSEFRTTEPEVFLDKRVRETRQTERGNTRSSASKKAQHFTNPFIHKSTLHSIQGYHFFSCNQDNRVKVTALGSLVSSRGNI